MSMTLPIRGNSSVFFFVLRVTICMDTEVEYTGECVAVSFAGLVLVFELFCHFESVFVKLFG